MLYPNGIPGPIWTIRSPWTPTVGPIPVRISNLLSPRTIKPSPSLCVSPVVPF
jgi:hypothetical protein